MTIRRKGETQFFEGDPRSIPPEIGTQPVPEGHVRFHHYTRPENVASIKEHGLLQSKNRDKVGDEQFVFMTAGVPRKQDMRSHVWVEGHANADVFSKGGQLDIGSYSGTRGGVEEHIKHMESHQSTITSMRDIPASQILGVHEPWHDAYRYMEREGMGKAIQAGEYDYVADEPDYGPALKAKKITNAATVMLGGKLR